MTKFGIWGVMRMVMNLVSKEPCLTSIIYIKKMSTFEFVKVQVILCVLLQNYIFVIKIIRSCFSQFGHEIPVDTIILLSNDNYHLTSFLDCCIIYAFYLHTFFSGDFR